MKKRIIAIFMVLFITFGVSGCRGTGSVHNENNPVKTIVDCNGRNVTIPENPERVACLYASTAHMMTMLGQENKIVGAPRGIKRDTLMLKKRPDIKNISVPFQDGSINIEELIKNKTEMVLLRRSTAASAGEIEKLDKAKIPYAVVDYTTIDELKQAIRVTGTVFNCSDKAEAYIAYCDRIITMVKNEISKIPDSDRIRVYHAVNEAARTDLEEDICSEIIEIAGGIDVSTGGGNLVTEEEKTMTTLEQIYSWNPEMFLVNEANTADYIRSDPKWTGLKAVQDQKVVNLPIGVTRWCHPGSMEPQMAILFIAKKLYPASFEDVNLSMITQTYYHDYFNLDLSEEEVLTILSGEGIRLPKGEET